ncbi:Ig-like domain-containing protein, partial [Vibrio vulnificus]|nr:Ig-like domain-containing protein [Vibrio vulnificus]
TATFSDATSSDVSNSVTWTPIDTATATVSSTGLLSGVEVGNTTLTATKDGVTSNTVDVNVSAAVITSIQVTPSPVSVAKGQTQQLTATATFSDATSSDVSNSVTWTPIDTATATVSSTGLLSGVEVGNTTLTATKDGVTSNTVNVNVSAAVITSIQVTPSLVNVAKGQTQQLTATATFSDATSSDVSNSVTWTSIDTATATVSSAGLLSAVEVGNTTLTATKDGVTSNTVDVNVCDLAGTCIDIFDTGSGKLFTSSPSVAYLDSIGGSATNGTYTEGGAYGPSGDFYRFAWTNANALCTTYNTLSLGGRTNWRLATRDELKTELYDVSGNMFTARGWPTVYYYWSATSDVLYYYSVNLNNGDVVSLYPSTIRYASCVSNP